PRLAQLWSVTGKRQRKGFKVRQEITNPPLGESAWPVTNELSSLAKYRAALAMSSAWPKRPRGVIAFRGAMSSGATPATMGVSMTPGHMALALMPRGPQKRARLRVNPSRAALAVA